MPAVHRVGVSEQRSDSRECERSRHPLSFGLLKITSTQH